MSWSFTVDTTALPAFADLVGAAALGEPLQLAGAGWTGAAWPKGLLAKVADASTVAASMELTPELEAAFERAGLAGSFLAFTAGCARGVVVTATKAGVSFSVLALSSPADYALAVRLAAAAARLTGASVRGAHDEGGGAADTRSADEALGHWGPSFAEESASLMGTWLADDIAEGRTYFFQGPRGWVKVAPDDLAGLPRDRRFARARELVLGEAESASAHATSVDPRRDAVLLTAAMVFAAGADGRLDEEEARQLEAHFATIRELRTFPARELLDAARAEVSGLDALSGLGPSRLRRKAFVLAAEVIASAREGRLAGEADDPNVKAVSALAHALGLDADQAFIARVVAAVMTKYAPLAGDAAVDDEAASKLVLGMLLAAAADGRVDDEEAALLSALARTVPELRRRDVTALFAAARAQMGEGLDVALRELDGLGPHRNKAFSLAAEVALVAGHGQEGTLLPTLRARIEPDGDAAEHAIAAFAAKFA